MNTKGYKLAKKTKKKGIGYFFCKKKDGLFLQIGKEKK
jgi:putative hemolysin